MPYIVLDETTAEAAPVVTIGAPNTTGDMSFTEMQQELALELGSRTDVSAVSSRSKLWINMAYRGLCQMLTIKELFGSFALATVDDQPFYAMPKQLAWIKDVSLADSTTFVAGGRKLEMIDEAGYRLLSDMDGETRKWFRYRRMLVVYPHPNAVYNLAVNCRIRPDKLVNPGDYSMLPSEFDEVILMYSRYRAFRGLRMYAEAATALNDAVTVLRPILNTDAEEKDSGEQQFQPITSKRQLYQGRDR